MPDYRPDGDIFNMQANVLVNPVNCQGVMGAGLALAFARAFPSILPSYRKACADGTLRPGGVFIARPSEAKGIVVANIATKNAWRAPARLEWVTSGVTALASAISSLGRAIEAPTKIAMPQLGCGLGGLKWAEVHEAILPAINEMEGFGHSIVLLGARPEFAPGQTGPSQAQ